MTCHIHVGIDLVLMVHVVGLVDLVRAIPVGEQRIFKSSSIHLRVKVRVIRGLSISDLEWLLWARHIGKIVVQSFAAHITAIADLQYWLFRHEYALLRVKGRAEESRWRLRKC